MPAIRSTKNSGVSHGDPCRVPAAAGRRKRGLRHNRGFAIISTLLVLTVLTIMVVAFLQSMRVERLTARSYLNKTRADLAAEAGTTAAGIKIEKLKSNSYAALFEAQGASDSSYLFLTRRVVNGAGTVEINRVPLFSTWKPDSDFNTLGTAALSSGSMTVADKNASGAAVTRTLSAASDISVNINKANSLYPLGRVGLWNGTNSANAVALPLPVNWLYLKDDQGMVVGRYAYWVDDENAKINLTTAGNLRGASNTHLREDGHLLDELSLQQLTDFGVPANELRALTKARLDYYGVGKLFTETSPMKSGFFRYLTQAVAAADPVGNSVLSDSTWKLLRGHVTVNSLEDDRTPSGRRKMNLNAVVTNTQDPARIKLEVEAIRDYILQELPDFGKRYYQSAVPGASDSSIYATKIAANIRDFIDTDCNATVVLNDGSILAGSEPGPELNDTLPVSSTASVDLPIAIGKERGPFLNEYTRLMKVISGPSSGTGIVTFRPVHYIELFNPGDTAISYADLGSSPFIRICNRAPWSYSPSTFRPADIKIYLPASFTIAAKGYAVLTTDGPPYNGSQTGLLSSISNLYSITKGSAAGQWEAVDAGGQNMPSGAGEDYTLTLTATTSSGKGRYSLQSNIRAVGYGSNETRILFGNNNGLIDMVVKSYEESNLYLGRNAQNPTVHNSNIAGNTTSNTNNATPTASSPRFSRADPRTNTEIMTISSDTRSVWIDGLGAYGDNMLDPRITPGTLNSSTNFATLTANSILPEGTADGPGAHLVLNEPVKSLGDLGGLYDPSRYASGYRGGGRTLRIGQSDDLTNLSRNITSPTSSDQNEEGGKSLDDMLSTTYNRNAGLLPGLFRIDNVTSGRVNLSSVVRSPVPLAFMGTQNGFVFKKAANGGTTLLEDKTLAVSGTQTQLTAAIKSEFQANRPILSPGEMSRLRIFSENTTLVTGVNMKDVEDKGREEWFRRSSNLLTTGSLSYTIHVIGQSGRFYGNKFRVDATSTRSSKMILSPQYIQPYDELAPTAPASWNTSLAPYELP